MKKSFQATSIIESMIVLLIVVTWIVWVFSLLNSSLKLSDATSQRIEAIQIARDGLEAFTNIRDTNWIKFSADYKNCWNTLNYNTSCIWTTGFSTDITHSATQWLIISRNTDNQFILTPLFYFSGWNTYTNSDYRSKFGIQKDMNWFYTQTWWTLYWVSGAPFYTRELQIRYLNSSLWTWNSDDERIEVTSIVQWKDISRNAPKKLEITTILTNWESQK
jgi:hypothetical protein